jgi:hypothetical protein
MAANHLWLITRDMIDGGRADGTCGPRDRTVKPEDLDASERTRLFRLLDADGEVYAEGLILVPAGEEGGLLDFSPLDDLGEPYWGCVSIEYREAGRWVRL